ncbi:unnamed protein product [Rotaria sp. Silwood2]|nr:unnamed protein product [Rotaria sp. Silwood2]CAF3382701.1 unnamed protein product [Rotaria sp. Silwood2]CAF4558418.1 unnamed protein product [Rotaria sp. Silwood2]CAF4671555.1 unnamed protein product [Rotaria sp. Silwood2]
MSGDDTNYLDADLWEQLISRYIPQLEKFYLQYNWIFDHDYEYPENPATEDQFISSFWIERQWTFESKVKNMSIEYFVCPYRKQWHDYEQGRTFNFSKSNLLTVTYNYPNNYDNFIRMDVKCALYVVKYYRLKIQNKELNISALIQAINLLPELDTLKIHSL